MRRVVFAVSIVLASSLLACNQQPPTDLGRSAGTAAPTAGQADSGERPLDAEAVVRQLASFYRSKKTFQVDFDQAISFEFGDMKKTTESKAKIIAERPNRIAMRQNDPQLGIDMVCDGEQLVMSVLPIKQYTQTAAPKSFDELLTNPLLAGGVGSRGPLLDLFSDDPFTLLMKGVTKAEHAGREKIGDRDAHHLRFEHAQVNWELWVDAGDQPLVLQAAFDMQKSLEALGIPKEQMGNAKMASLQHYRNWQFDAPLNEGAFVLAPPAGAKQVSDFFAEGASPSQPESSPLVGRPAPDVEGELLDGGRFSLRALRGKKVVILDFWATWCGPCVQEMPLLAQVAEEYAGKDVALYCLNLRENADTIRKFLDREKLQVTVSLDSTGATGLAYGVEGIPTLVLIDKAGVVQSVHVGFSPDIGEKLKAELDSILSVVEAHDAPDVDLE